MNNVAKRVIFSKLMFWLLVAVTGLYYLFPNLFLLQTKNRFEMPRINLGIDLRGGTYITLEVDVDKVIEGKLKNEVKNIEKFLKSKKVKELPKIELINQSIIFTFKNAEQSKISYNILKDNSHLTFSKKDNTILAVMNTAEELRIRSDAVEQAIQVIRSRVDGFGVAGSVVQRHGDTKIVVQLPGVDDPQRVKDLITRRAHLEFKLIQQDALKKSDLEDRFEGEIPADLMVISGEQKDDIGDDETAGRWYIVSAFPDLTGDRIVDSGVGYDEYGRPHVSFTLDKEGAKTFRELTGNNIGRSLGIIIDNVVLSAPRIQSEIGASGQITGNYSLKDAQDLALVLKTGSFQAPVKYLEERRIGPSLGQDSINKGLMSCLIGLLLVFLFSLFVYRLHGLFAMLALVYNLFLILLFLSFFNATLTLPGIAGMALTIGMAIDASILIYEKMREELMAGAPYRKALNDGFKGAMAVILDSNITTFLSGLVLFYFGGPIIQGFAITIMLGIVATIIAGVYFLKSIFDFILDVFGVSKVNF